MTIQGLAFQAGQQGIESSKSEGHRGLLSRAVQFEGGISSQRNRAFGGSIHLHHFETDVIQTHATVLSDHGIRMGFHFDDLGRSELDVESVQLPTVFVVRIEGPHSPISAGIQAIENLGQIDVVGLSLSEPQIVTGRAGQVGKGQLGPHTGGLAGAFFSIGIILQPEGHIVVGMRGGHVHVHPQDSGVFGDCTAGQFRAQHQIGLRVELVGDLEEAESIVGQCICRVGELHFG